MAYGKKRYLLCLVLLLASCSVLSPVKTNTETNYELNTVPSVAVKKPHRAILVVTSTEANSIYSSPRMVYSLNPYQISYYSKNRWAMPPNRMLQQLIIQTLQKTHYYHAVISPSVAGNFDYVLNTQLIELRQDFSSNPSMLRLTVRAQLIKSNSSRVVAAKQFTVVRLAPQNTPYGGVLAANEAVADFLRQLASFCVKNSK